MNQSYKYYLIVILLTLKLHHLPRQTEDTETIGVVGYIMKRSGVVYDMVWLSLCVWNISVVVSGVL